MASKNHLESIAEDATCGVGWMAFASASVRNLGAAAGSQIARSATMLSAKDFGALGSFVESELKRPS
jgi:hypothetical protein